MKAYYETCVCGGQVWPQPSGRWVCDACGRDHGPMTAELRSTLAQKIVDAVDALDEQVRE